MTWRIERGDCIETMAAMPAASVDAVVTDPPYGLEFMGKEWDSFRVDERSARWASKSGAAGDFGTSHLGGATTLPSYTRRRTTSRCLTCGKRDAFRSPHGCGDAEEWTTEWVDSKPVELRAFQNWCEQWAAEALRILKPGGHLLAFGGTRTFHRLACAVEEAGFEVRDCIAWMYGNGFPKSMDVAKALDAQADDLARRWFLAPHGAAVADVLRDAMEAAAADLDAGAEAAQGWGTALKPALEPVVVARKAPTGTVAGNFLEHRTGALNIEASRVPMSAADRQGWESGRLAWAERDQRHGQGRKVADVYGTYGETLPADAPEGRWPANVLFDETAATALDAQTAPLGGASRFFYCPKASTAERNAGLAGFRESDKAQIAGADRDGEIDPVSGRFRSHMANVHPTVKPIDLMRWLVRLVTPPGGTVLDPFTGSGTTGCAAVLEGFDFVGCEREDEYADIAEARIAWWVEQPADVDLIDVLRAAEQRRKVAETGQSSLLDLFDDATREAA